MVRVRMSTLGLALTFLLLLVLLLLLQSTLLAAHLDNTIDYFAADAANYFSLYEHLYAELDLSENPALFLIGSPILFMKLASGDLFLIQAFNLALMAVSLKIAFDCLPGRRARFEFMAGARGVPPLLFGLPRLLQEGVGIGFGVFSPGHHA